MNLAGISYPIALFEDSDIALAFQVSALPTYVVIGRDGRIASHQTGVDGEKGLRKLLAAAGLE